MNSESIYDQKGTVELESKALSSVQNKSENRASRKKIIVNNYSQNVIQSKAYELKRQTTNNQNVIIDY